jgi:Restriction endonuclease S subunits
VKNIREGYKRTEVGVIPIDWDIDKLSNLVEKITDGTHKTPTYTDDGVPFLRVTDIQKSKIDWNNVKYISEEEHRELIKRCNPEIGDILYSKNGTIGIPKIIDWNKEFSIFVSLCLIKMKKENNRLSNKYLEKYLASDSCMNQIRLRAKQGTVTNLHLEEIRELIIPMPSIEEQERISLVLSSVDEQIEITDNLIEKTKELKKGLMQKLLIKGIGHSRFKDTEIGKIPEKWEVTNLIDISQGKGEYGIGAVATEYVVGNPRYLRITDIGDESRLLFNDIKGLDDEEYEKYILKHNDIVFARTGNTTGKSYVYNTKDGDLVYAGFLIKFSINPKLANVNFIKYVIQSKRYWDWVNVMSTRSGQPGINSNEYAKLLIQIPSIEEQNQIALVISSVDEKIEQYDSKKEKLQELKKGLMQKLLTGKVRVS